MTGNWNILVKLREMSSKFSNGPGSKARNPLWLIALAAFASAGLAETAPDFRTVPAKEHYGKAVEYGDQGLWAAALLELNRALATEPGNPSILVELGIVHAERQEWQPALEALRGAVAAATAAVAAAATAGAVAGTAAVAAAGVAAAATAAVAGTVGAATGTNAERTW